MDCASFSQTETMIIGSMMLFFMCTTFWFWALWFEGPTHDSSHYVKRVKALVKSGDEVTIRSKKGDTTAMVNYFYRNFMGRMRVKIHYYYGVRGEQKTCAPERIVFVHRKGTY